MTRPLEKLALELQKATSPMELMGLLPDLAAGIRDLQFAEACGRSAATGAWVDLEKTA